MHAMSSNGEASEASYVDFYRRRLKSYSNTNARCSELFMARKGVQLLNLVTVIKEFLHRPS